MPAATVVYFGQHPSTIVMQSSSNFDGTVQTGVPTITPALYVFPLQAGGGLYNFHSLVGTQEPVSVLSISYKGGGTLTIKRQLSSLAGTPMITVGQITTEGDLVFEEGDLTLSPNEDLIITSTGATNPIVSITAMLTNSMWAS